MKGTSRTTRTTLLFAMLALAATACDRSADGATAADSAQQAQAQPADAVAEQDGDAGAAGFDIETVPVSTLALGAFPYIGLPAGYRANGPETSDFDRFPYWVGDRFEWVEGPTWATFIGTEPGKQMSELEVRRNLEHVVAQAGGVKVFEGRVPAEAVKSLGEDVMVRHNTGLGGIGNRPSTVFLVRRPDRNIWIHLNTYSAGGSLAISESADFAASAGLLPADGAASGGEAGGFDIAALPASTVALGAFPYFSIPDGYRETPRQSRRLDHGQAAFWVGDRFETVEGQVYAAGMRVERDAGKDFSATEVARNIEHVVTAAGGVKVHSGEEPAGARQDKAVQAVMREYPAEAKCLVMNPVEVYVLRRDDGNVWVRACTSRHFAGLIVVRERALVPTSTLLPADDLRAKIEADGRVAIQVHFAVDKADILPASQPQVEQVVALLEGSDALRLHVDGHTDNTGDAARNQALSEARAAAVVAALVEAGIAADRLEARGFGTANPVADNGTDDGRAANRRVELVRR
ncbi:OmpA family protein [Luteimonas sp. A649]